MDISTSPLVQILVPAAGFRKWIYIPSGCYKVIGLSTHSYLSPASPHLFFTDILVARAVLDSVSLFHTLLSFLGSYLLCT